MQIIYMLALISHMNLNKQPMKYIYGKSLTKLRVQIRMPNSWFVKSDQVSKRVRCTYTEVRKGCVYDIKIILR